MIILKFGGTSIGDGARIAAVAELVCKRKRENPLVVVSALSGVTDELAALTRAARSANAPEIDRILASLRERHLQAVKDAGIGSSDQPRMLGVIEDGLAIASDLARGVALTRELTTRTSDALLATGELLSSRIVAAAIGARGGDAVWIDPRDLVATECSSGTTVPDERAIAANCAEHVVPEVDRGRLVVTGGFVGRNPKGETTTLGRGGSDTTAALLGAALGTTSIEIWTDVDGLLTADPRIVRHARRIPELSYAEAAELSFFGAKVIHPASIRPASRRGIPIRIRNTFRPGSAGTTIRAHADGTGVRALAARGRTSAICVTNPRMLHSHGYAARVFSVFERHQIPVDVIATSEVSIAATVDESVPLDGIVRELEAFVDTQVLHGLGVLTVVGRCLRSTPGIGARIFGALDDINVVLISQGASETNFTLVLEERDLPAAMNRLHEEFFGAYAPSDTPHTAAEAAP